MQTMCLVGPTMWEHSIRVCFNRCYLYLLACMLLDTIALRQQELCYEKISDWYPTPTPSIGGWHRRTRKTSDNKKDIGQRRQDKERKWMAAITMDQAILGRWGLPSSILIAALNLLCPQCPTTMSLEGVHTTTITHKTLLEQN
jgi:hypothetical protein